MALVLARRHQVPSVESTDRPTASQYNLRSSWIFGKVLDPRCKAIQQWNRILLLSRVMGVVVDPMFFYLLVISQEQLCLYIDSWFALLVTILRSASDVMLLGHIWLQLKLPYVCKESLVVGRRNLVWDAQKIVLHYFNFKGIIFDAFVILPVPQVMFWIVVPYMLKKGGNTAIMTTLIVVFIFQFLPKLFHLMVLVRRMQRATGYVFGTVGWGFALNLLAYAIAAHVVGSCWYLLAIQRVETCLERACHNVIGCDSSSLGCSSLTRVTPMPELSSSPLAQNSSIFPLCMQASNSSFSFGIYQFAVALVSTTNGLQRMLYSFFWGLMTLSSAGNALTPTNHMLEVVFCIIVVTCGILLFTMLIGNIQVFLHSIFANKGISESRSRDLEWWMRRRRLPTILRQKVRNYNRDNWAATRGIDEDDMVKGLPEGLRREIKRHVFNLVRQVPLFGQMDEIVLDNICDRVRPLLHIKGEVVIRQGEPIPRMLFIFRGCLRYEQRAGANKTYVDILRPGDVAGDELWSWYLRRPFVGPLPLSSATITCLDSVETYGLGADDLRFLAENMQDKFTDERLIHTIRHHSPGCRTRAAIVIQLAWRRPWRRLTRWMPRSRREYFSSWEEEEKTQEYFSSWEEEEKTHDGLPMYASLQEPLIRKHELTIRQRQETIVRATWPIPASAPINFSSSEEEEKTHDGLPMYASLLDNFSSSEEEEKTHDGFGYMWKFGQTHDLGQQTHESGKTHKHKHTHTHELAEVSRKRVSDPQLEFVTDMRQRERRLRQETSALQEPLIKKDELTNEGEGDHLKTL